MASATTKFLTLATLFLVLLSAVHGTIYRTIVTTTETITDDEAGSSSEEERCSQEVQKQSLDSCRRYLQSGQESLLMVRGKSNQGGVPQPCCQQMEKLRNDCTCYALRYLVRELQQEGQEQEQGQGQEHGGRDQGELVSRALQIPLECNLEARSCRISED